MMVSLGKLPIIMIGRRTLDSLRDPMTIRLLESHQIEVTEGHRDIIMIMIE